MPTKRRPSRKPTKVTFETVRQLALALPEAEESTSYGMPAFKVRGKLFVRLHQDGDSIVVPIDPQERAMRLQADPHTYHITDHYVNHPLMLVRLESVQKDDLRSLLEQSWRHVAPARLAAAYEG